MEETVQDSATTPSRFTDKLFGGLNMSWPVVIIMAVASAIVTSIFLIVPIFKGTSFERMGIFLEAWIPLALIVATNCKKPLEAALKTFVFFLVSQPLIYLIQVPFSSIGWGLFNYYGYWFIWTLATFPLAALAWYVTKKNWLSLLILTPVLALLGGECLTSFQETAAHFPHLLITGLFCLAQILLYLYAFTSNLWQKLVGLLVPIAVVLVLFLRGSQEVTSFVRTLPDGEPFTTSATISSEDTALCDVHFVNSEMRSIEVTPHAHGTTKLKVTDGGKEYVYTIKIFDENGNMQTEIDVAQ